MSYRMILCAALPNEIQSLCKRLKASIPNPDNPTVGFNTPNHIEGTILVSGVGRERMKFILQQVSPDPVWVWISIGFSGALLPELRIGEVLSGTSVLTSKGELFQFPPPAYFDFREEGRILCCADQAATTRGEKQILHLRTGAALVDMESAETARQAKIRREGFLWVRVISDTLEDSLPKPILHCFDEKGFPNSRKAMRQIVKHPWLLPTFIRLEKRSRILSEHLADTVLSLLESFSPIKPDRRTPDGSG